MLTSRAALLLQTWLSPAFPTGGFGYSHGLERAIHDRQVRDAATLADWIDLLLTTGSGWTDAVLFAAAHSARAEGLSEIAGLCEALAPSRERRAETVNQGDAFLASLKAWPDDRPDLTTAPYPVAVGAACAKAGVPLESALTGYLNAFATQLISVAVRVIPIGQSDGLAALARLHPVIRATAARAAVSTLDDLGGASLASDIASLRHEIQPVRLFLS